ncbi:MAG: hypothetical protein V3U89_06135 [Methylophilaceae bacterium]
MHAIKGKTVLFIGVVILAISPSLPLPDKLIASSMVVHMLFQLPMAIFAGVLCASLLHHSSLLNTQHFAVFASCWLWAYFSILFWLLPVNLDKVLVDQNWDILKLCSLFLAGIFFKNLFHSNSIIKLFFIGSLAMMLLFMGFYYQQTETRLCSGYLLDAQQNTGVGLTLFGFILIGFFIVQFRKDSQH